MGDNCLDSDQHTRDCKTLQPRDPESTSILALSHTYVLQYAGGLAERRQWRNIFNNVSRYETFLRKVVGIGIARWIWQSPKFHANTLEMSLFLQVHNLNFRVTFYACTCTPCMRHSAGRRNLSRMRIVPIWLHEIRTFITDRELSVVSFRSKYDVFHINLRL